MLAARVLEVLVEFTARDGGFGAPVGARHDLLFRKGFTSGLGTVSARARRFVSCWCRFRGTLRWFLDAETEETSRRRRVKTRRSVDEMRWESIGVRERANRDP